MRTLKRPGQKSLERGVALVKSKPTPAKGKVDISKKELDKAVAKALVATKNKSQDSATEVILQTKFGSHSQTIVDMIEMNNSDGASALIVKTLIQSLVEILPVAEHNVRSTNATKGIYGFNTLVSSIRELLGDLQAFKDRSNLGQSVVDRAVRPSFQDIAVQIVTSLTIVQDSAKSRMDAADYREFRNTIEEQKKALANYIHAQYLDVSSQVVKSLS